MKASVLLLLVVAGTALAQIRESLWIDLSGNWRMKTGDRPDYASTDFDDTGWMNIALPLGENHIRDPHWLRKRVLLPERTNRSQLALTLGTIQDVYEVYINGRKAGASGDYYSFEQAQIPRPRHYFFVLEPSPANPPLQIALRVKQALIMVPTWRLPDKGPYLLTYPWHTPVGVGQEQADNHWFVSSPSLIFAVIFLVFGVLAFIAWWSDRRRRELLWFALLALRSEEH